MGTESESEGRRVRARGERLRASGERLREREKVGEREW